MECWHERFAANVLIHLRFWHFPATFLKNLPTNGQIQTKTSSWASHLDRHGWSWTPWRLVCDSNLIPLSWSSKHILRIHCKLSWKTVSHIEYWVPPIPKPAWIFCLTSLHGGGTFTLKIHCFADHPRTTRRLFSGGERNGPGGVISHFLCLLTIQKPYGLTHIEHFSGYLKTSKHTSATWQNPEKHWPLNTNWLQTKYQKQWYETNTDTDTNVLHEAENNQYQITEGQSANAVGWRTWVYIRATQCDWTICIYIYTII